MKHTNTLRIECKTIEIIRSERKKEVPYGDWWNELETFLSSLENDYKSGAP